MKYKTVFSNETDIFNNNTGIAIMKIFHIHYWIRQVSNYINGMRNQSLTYKK